MPDTVLQRGESVANTINTVNIMNLDKSEQLELAKRNYLETEVALISAEEGLRAIAERLIRSRAIEFGYGYHNNKWLIGFSDGDCFIEFERASVSRYSTPVLSLVFKQYSVRGKLHKTSSTMCFDSALKRLKRSPTANA